MPSVSLLFPIHGRLVSPGLGEGKDGAVDLCLHASSLNGGAGNDSFAGPESVQQCAEVSGQVLPYIVGLFLFMVLASIVLTRLSMNRSVAANIVLAVIISAAIGAGLLGLMAWLSRR